MKKAVLATLAILTILMATPAEAAALADAEARATHERTVYGRVELDDGGTLSKTTIFDETAKTYTPALQTRGSVKIQSVQVINIQGLGVGVRSMPGVEERATFLFRDNTVSGTNTADTTGLSLDARLTSDSKVEANTFEHLVCGISVSVDIVFDYLPPEDREAAFEKLAAELEADNTFVNVAQPVCGGRG